MTDQIVNLLETERDRIDAAILALRGEKRRGRPPQHVRLLDRVANELRNGTPVAERTRFRFVSDPKKYGDNLPKKRRAWTAKEKAQISKRVKAMWAAKRKAA